MSMKYKMRQILVGLAIIISVSILPLLTVLMHHEQPEEKDLMVNNTPRSKNAESASTISVLISLHSTNDGSAHESSTTYQYMHDLERNKVFKDCKRTYFGNENTIKINVTASGLTCQNWADQFPHRHVNNRDIHFPDSSMLDAKNYCRNPDCEPDGPWCYTTNRKIRWEYCDVTCCAGSTCAKGNSRCRNIK